MADNTTTPQPRPEFWRGLEEYVDSPAFREMLHREFPEDASAWEDPVSRRQFLTLAGAGLALAGAAGCSPRPASRKHIIPYVKQPEAITPGLALYFATAAPVDGVGLGVLVKSYEGRPVKIEGNPDHPSSLGGSDAVTQATLLTMYDPDRSQTVMKDGMPTDWDSASFGLRQILEKHKEKRGAGVRFLTEPVTSPTLAALFEDLLKDYPEAKWVQYSPCGTDSIREGLKTALGTYAHPVYNFSEAKVVVTLEGGPLVSGPGHVRYNRDFAFRRKARSKQNAIGKDGVALADMNRLYAIESMPTTAGTASDHRLALKPSEIETFARALAVELKVPGAPEVGSLPAVAKGWLAPLAKDLLANKGKALVVAGESQPASLHAVVAAINDTLEAVGKTVTYVKPLEARPANTAAEFKTLVEDMKAGKVELLFVLGVNPLYTAPADLEFDKAFDKVAARVHMGLYQDETAVRCHWHIPQVHFVEAWGDIRGHDGTVTIQQPLIAPLFAGRSPIELLASLLGRGESDGREVVQAYWRQEFETRKAEGTFREFWDKSLQDGVVADTAFKPIESVKPSGDWAKSLPSPKASSGLEVSFLADPTIGDGRNANNGWLQEVPKPITKLTWDNAAIVSPVTARKLGLTANPRWTAGEHGRMEVNIVSLKYKGREVKAPAWILPGHPDDTVTLHLGYGRKRAGRVGSGMGFDAYALRTSEAPNFDGGLELTKTRDTYFLACTQAHHSMEGRKPVRYITAADYTDSKKLFNAIAPAAAAGEAKAIQALLPSNKDSAHHDHGHDHGHDHSHGEKKNGNGHAEDESHGRGHDSRLVPLTMYPPSSKKNRRWAMAIDLSACDGCSACVVACVAENNTPVVGKDQVTAGREMHWLRIDRYYSGDPESPEMLTTHVQPVACVQCEKAPCEVVCPVGATVHSGDGLNDMVYNRCVGTRYCSNNCPYKVRRFNFLTYSDYATESLKLLRNPEVSVRTRGVMEKCTFCVQRIRHAEYQAEQEGRPIEDGEVVTACQAACPTQAIMFGDLAKDESVVNRWKAEPTNYGLLAELNTMPRLTYLAAVKNPNPNMPKAEAAKGA